MALHAMRVEDRFDIAMEVDSLFVALRETGERSGQIRRQKPVDRVRAARIRRGRNGNVGGFGQVFRCELRAAIPVRCGPGTRLRPALGVQPLKRVGGPFGIGSPTRFGVSGSRRGWRKQSELGLPFERDRHRQLAQIRTTSGFAERSPGDRLQHHQIRPRLALPFAPGLPHSWRGEVKFRTEVEPTFRFAHEGVPVVVGRRERRDQKRLAPDVQDGRTAPAHQKAMPSRRQTDEGGGPDQERRFAIAAHTGVDVLERHLDEPERVGEPTFGRHRGNRGPLGSVPRDRLTDFDAHAIPQIRLGRVLRQVVGVDPRYPLHDGSFAEVDPRRFADIVARGRVGPRCARRGEQRERIDGERHADGRHHESGDQPAARVAKHRGLAQWIPHRE